jgi:methylthioribose-1-phosphate isomerase
LCEAILPTIYWDPKVLAVKMIDQQRLPNVVEFLTLTSCEDVARPICEMYIQGEPVIRTASGFGLAVAAAYSSNDRAIEHSASEMLDIQRAGMPIAPQGSEARNPAFDITPSRLVTALITKMGIFKPPYATLIAQAFIREANA